MRAVTTGQLLMDEKMVFNESYSHINDMAIMMLSSEGKPYLKDVSHPANYLQRQVNQMT